VEKIILSDQKTLKEEKINEFSHGLRPDNSKIGVYKDAEYAIFKDHINPLANGYVDLLLTRQFSGGLFVQRFSPRTFIFNSSDSKTGNLIGKYGIDIMGINQEWFDIRQKDVYRLVLVQQIKQIYKIG